MKKVKNLDAKAANDTVAGATVNTYKNPIEIGGVPKQTLRYLDGVKVRALCEGVQIADAEDRRSNALFRVVKALLGYRSDGQASKATYLHIVIDSGVKDSWRAAKRIKRTHEMLTLDAPVPETNGYDGSDSMIDLVADEDDGGFARTDDRLDVEAILGSLTPVQTRVCRFLMDGALKCDIPRLVGITEYEFKHKILPSLAKAFREFQGA